jgi:hypothetical protein
MAHADAAMPQVVVQTSSSAGHGVTGPSEFHDKLTVRAGGFGNALEVPLAAHLPRPLLRVSTGAPQVTAVAVMRPWRQQRSWRCSMLRGICRQQLRRSLPSQTTHQHPSTVPLTASTIRAPVRVGATMLLVRRASCVCKVPPPPCCAGA